MLNHLDPWDEFLENTCAASAMAGKLLITAFFLTLEAQAISTTRSLSRHLSRMSLQTGLSGFFCYQIHLLVISSTAFLLSRLPQIAFAMESAFLAILLELQSMVV
jgi:hypothetical protein